MKKKQSTIINDINYPHDDLAEQIVLSHLLHNAQLHYFHLLKFNNIEQPFYLLHHNILFSLLQQRAYDDNGYQYKVVEYIKKHQKITEVGGETYLNHLYELNPCYHDVNKAYDKVISCAMLRNIIVFCDQVVSDASSEQKSPAEIIKFIHDTIYDIDNTKDRICLNCQYSQYNGRDDFRCECIRHAPILSNISDENNRVFPQVNINDTCGDFKLKD